MRSHMQKNKIGPLPLPLYKVNSKLIKSLNIGTKILKLIGKKHGNKTS